MYFSTCTCLLLCVIHTAYIQGSSLLDDSPPSVFAFTIITCMADAFFIDIVTLIRTCLYCSCGYSILLNISHKIYLP